ncbi:hypothetical protein pb186bvf_004724 [Paramecium bursaria]
MFQNPPPIISMYRQSLKECEKKHFVKLWSQEPQEVKQFFSAMFQALKYTGKSYNDLLVLDDQSTSQLSFDQFSSIPIIKEQESEISILKYIEDKSAFLNTNSFFIIEQMCQQLKSMKLDDSLYIILDKSFQQLYNYQKK